MMLHPKEELLVFDETYPKNSSSDIGESVLVLVKDLGVTTVWLPSGMNF